MIEPRGVQAGGGAPTPLVLVVEDSPSEAALTVAALRRNGLTHEAVVADTLADARTVLLDRPVSCVVLDLGLPDSEGLSGLHALRDDVDVPVVVLTGRDDSELALESLGNGAQDYLVKGRTDGDLLVRTVRYAIERHRVEREARAGYELAQSVLDAMDAHTAVIDAAGVIVSTNRAWSEFALDNGGDADTCGPGTSYLDVCRASGASEAVEGIESVLAGAAGSCQLEYACHGAGVRRWFEMRVRPVDLPSGRGAVVTHSVITEQKQVQERLSQLAATDPLTGVANRSVVVDAIDQALQSVRSTGSLAAVAFIDLDRFKTVNDNHGHGVGDLVIAQAAARLQGCARTTDLVARFGGDEFVVVCRAVGAQRDAVAVAERWLAELSRPFVVDGRSVVVGATVGLAFASRGTESPEQLLIEADAAMYQAKAAGRGQLAVAPVT